MPGTEEFDRGKQITSETDRKKVSQQPNDPELGSEQVQLDRLELGKGLVRLAVLAVALLFALVVAVVELRRLELSETHLSAVGTMFSVTVGVIGTLVGTFFGINLGSEGKENAENRRDWSDPGLVTGSYQSLAMSSPSYSIIQRSS